MQEQDNFSALGITRSIVVSMIVSLPVSFHNFINFVNFTVEAASSYESGQFPVGRRWAYVALARTKKTQHQHSLKSEQGIWTILF